MKFDKTTVAEYVALEKQRAELAAQARRIESQANRLKKIIVEGMTAAGKTSCKRGAFTCCLQEVPGRISWKDVALPRLQPGELETLQAAVVPSVKLVVSAAA